VQRQRMNKRRYTFSLFYVWSGLQMINKGSICLCFVLAFAGAKNAQIAIVFSRFRKSVALRAPVPDSPHISRTRNMSGEPSSLRHSKLVILVWSLFDSRGSDWIKTLIYADMTYLARTVQESDHFSSTKPSPPLGRSWG